LRFRCSVAHELGLAGGNIRELLEENFRDSTVQFLRVFVSIKS